MRYCDPKVNRFKKNYIDYEGSDNLLELNQILSVYMIRRLKKDILKELPPKKR